MASPAPKSPEQSEKSKKYDRQLRLWGDHGQAALETCHVCLINATGLGTEVLKSLVLPAIGAFTIVDGKKITEEDLGTNSEFIHSNQLWPITIFSSNMNYNPNSTAGHSDYLKLVRTNKLRAGDDRPHFFLDVDSVGKPRAQIATQLLLELNPDVKGDYVDECPEQLLENNPNFFTHFTVVIAIALSERVLIPLSKSLWAANVPLIVAKSCGLIGYARIQLREHTVVESHPDTQNPDLRLDRPFPALLRHVESIDLDGMDLKDHAHVPYVVPLLKCLQAWRSQHGGNLPANYKEKENFRMEIRKCIRLNEDGVPEAEENFEEAIRAVNFATLPTGISKDVQDILKDDSCINLTSKSKPFWIMARALQDFVANEGEGLLPLRGSLPDMTADTTGYIALQQIYQQESLRCAEIVHRRAQHLVHHLGLADDLITEADTRLFCKHASDLAVVRGTSIADEYDPKTPNASYITQQLDDPTSLMVYYVMLRGVDKFYAEYNTYPGEFNVEADIVKLKGCISKLLGEWGCTSVAKDDYVHEICRYGGSEWHSVSAFIGGCVAQEAIKLITGQYKPVNNTFIYDAITSNTETFTF